MDYLELSPPPPLDRLVHRFWFLRTGAGAESSGMQTIVPDGRCEIVLHLGEPFAELAEPTRDSYEMLPGLPASVQDAVRDARVRIR